MFASFFYKTFRTFAAIKVSSPVCIDCIVKLVKEENEKNHYYGIVHPHSYGGVGAGQFKYRPGWRVVGQTQPWGLVAQVGAPLGTGRRLREGVARQS